MNASNASPDSLENSDTYSDFVSEVRRLLRERYRASLDACCGSVDEILRPMHEKEVSADDAVESLAAELAELWAEEN